MEFATDYLNKTFVYKKLSIVGVCTRVSFDCHGMISLLIEFCDNTGRPCEWWIDARDAEEDNF